MMFLLLTVRALLCLCHGVTEHMQRYQKLGDYLAENLILMFGHDHGNEFIAQP